MLTEESVSSQVDLMRILGDLNHLRVHSGGPLPVLVDMDIHYRLMKLMYCRSTSAFDFHNFLRHHPIFYGV